MDIMTLQKINKINLQLANMMNKYAPVQFRNTSYGAGRSNANQTGTLKMQIFPQEYCQDLLISWSNHYRGGSLTLIPNTNSITLKASIEVNGVITPIYFSGKRTVVIEPGATVTCDPAYVIIQPTDTAFIRTYFDVGAGGYLPIGAVHKLLDGVSYGVDYTDSGTVAAASNVVSWCPSLILGRLTSYKPSVLLIGDSIQEGSGDYNYSGYAVGFAGRKLTDAKIGFTKVSCGGDHQVGFLQYLYVRAPFASIHKYVICNYGINDVMNVVPLATMKLNALKIWAYFGNRGLKIYQTTLTPQTTSTDYWTTLANQTINANESIRTGFNSWLKDASASGAMAQSNGTLAGIFDVASFVETNGKWNVNTTPIASGTVTSATVNSLTDTNMTAFVVHSLDSDCVVKITGGTGAGQVRLVTTNSPANKLNITPDFTTTPDTTSTYQILRVATQDGTHPSPSSAIAMGQGIDLNKLT